MEETFRQAMVLSRGSFMTFIDRPLSGMLLALALLILVVAVLPAVRQRREAAFRE